MERITKVKTRKCSRIRQGDIYREIKHIERVEIKRGILEISRIIFPYIIVLTQDCDLESDERNRNEVEKKPEFNHDKYLFSALVAPLYNFEHFIAGEHLSNLGLKMRRDMSGAEKKKIKINEVPRFHYIAFPEELDIVDSVIDFKHYFSVNIETLTSLRKKDFVCCISELFREEISDRFGHYLARIGVPWPKPIPEAVPSQQVDRPAD